MLIEMPEFGQIDHKQVASLAPQARDKWPAPRPSPYLRRPRQALYMPVLVAIRFNADMKT